MPNHITNVLEFDCSPDEFKKIAEFLRGSPDRPLGHVDFNTLIPMPPSLDVEAGSRGDTGLMAYREYLRRSFGLGKEEAKKLEETYRERFSEDPEIWDLGKQYYENIENYGAANWYDWRIRNWGTKWNAYDCAPVDPESGMLSFCTAWSGVPEMVTAISEKFPTVSIRYGWADEDIGRNVGRFTMKDGMVTDHDIPAPDSREAFEMAAEIMDADLSDWGLTLSKDGTTYVWHEPEPAAEVSKTAERKGDAR